MPRINQETLKLRFLESKNLKTASGWHIAQYGDTTMDAVTHTLFTLHKIACANLASLAALHIFAAIKHQIPSRGDLLKRMF